MGFVLAMMERLTGEFSTIVTVVVGAYMGANAAVEWAQKK